MIFTAVFLLLSYIVISIYDLQDYSGLIVSIAIFFLIISSISFVLLSRYFKYDKNKPLKGIAIGIISKVVPSIIFVIIYMYYFSNKTLEFLILFFALYLLYSVFTLIYLFHNLRQISDSDINEKNNDFE